MFYTGNKCTFIRKPSQRRSALQSVDLLSNSVKGQRDAHICLRLMERASGVMTLKVYRVLRRTPNYIYSDTICPFVLSPLVALSY